MLTHQTYSYKDMTDEEIVSLVVGVPPCEEAAVYLIYDRYNPLMRRLYLDYISDCDDLMYLDVAKSYVYERLKGSKANWNPLRNFRGECHFAHWMKDVCYQCVIKFFHDEIEDEYRKVSIDIQDEDGDWVEVYPEKDASESYEKNQTRVEVLSAINMLENKDHRFCLIKQLQGYSSKEIADMLAQKWDREGIARFNKEGECIIPNFKYIDSLNQHAREKLKEILSEK